METELFLMFLTLLISSTVSRSEDHVFVQTGGSVRLDIKNQALPQFDKLIWINDKSQNVVRFSNQTGVILNRAFTHRVEFDNKTFSLTLKNVLKSNRGLYKANIEGKKETTIAEYEVSVIDPVDSPVLEKKVTVISFNSCIVNVSCTAHDLQLNTSYYNICGQEEVTSSGIETLILYCIENVVVCNHSNPVSWRNATLEIDRLCTPPEPFNSTKNPEENSSPFPLLWLLVIAGVPVLVFTAVSVICCFYKKPKKETQQQELTIYAQVKPKNKAQNPLEMLEKSANPQTVYGFTGDPKEPQNPSQTMIRTQTASEHPNSTIYSTIGQNQTPKETDQTIYSVVSKSSRGRTRVH